MGDPAEPTITTLDLGFVNAFLIQGQRPVLVDTGMPDHVDDIVDGMAKQGVDPEELSLILLTHGHQDHFGGAAGFKELTDAPLAVHEADAEAVRKGKNPPLHPTGLLGRLMKPLAGGDDATPVEPDIVLEGHEPLDRFGIHGRILPTPGHTPGSITLDLESGDCLAGDLLARSLRKTTPGLPPFADGVDAIHESLRQVLDRKPRRIYVGHGGPFDPDDVACKLF